MHILHFQPDLHACTRQQCCGLEDMLCICIPLSNSHRLCVMKSKISAAMDALLMQGAHNALGDLAADEVAPQGI